MITRILKITDSLKPQIKLLGQKFFSLTGLTGEFHDETFVEFWNQLLSRGLSATWICVDEHKLVGLLGMNLTIGIFDGKTVAEEAFWFVDPEHRGLAGLKLFIEAKQWAKEVGADRMTMACMDNIDPERVESFYRRYGFRKLQTQYVLDIDP